MYDLQAKDGRARAGILKTDHGEVLTPVFMPVGTQGSVKAVEQRELTEMDVRIILGNAYHLYLRPGTSRLEEFGGLHRFMSWERAILTDSGGYQVFSLSNLRQVGEDGVQFKSHLDGSPHFLSPELVVSIQRSIGSDIMMVLDECVASPSERSIVAAAAERTTRWAARSREAFVRSGPLYGFSQAQFGIVQGGVDEFLRTRSVSELVSIGFDGYAIGGLAVGEPQSEMLRMIDVVEPILPEHSPRYLMGVGLPADLIEAVSRGIDMFDCVVPTRNARNGQLFTSRGTLNLRNAAHRDDAAPVDENCSCYTCRTFSRAYLRHLLAAKEILALQLASLHNVSYFHTLVRDMRSAILEARFESWKRETLTALSTVNSLT